MQGDWTYTKTEPKEKEESWVIHDTNNSFWDPKETNQSPEWLTSHLGYESSFRDVGPHEKSSVKQLRLKKSIN